MTTKLPTELERTIFEITALSRPLSISTLMLVAWRVKKWTAAHGILSACRWEYVAGGMQRVHALSRMSTASLNSGIKNNPPSLERDAQTILGRAAEIWGFPVPHADLTESTDFAKRLDGVDKETRDGHLSGTGTRPKLQAFCGGRVRSVVTHGATGVIQVTAATGGGQNLLKTLSTCATVVPELSRCGTVGQAEACPTVSTS
ncbi:hypothetical protein B0H13DRAFT_1852046 [Mycena leptocephala]|nr:hypothetical protein B0H13DRAFT_1852046 [Mycena leptocephala]